MSTAAAFAQSINFTSSPLPTGADMAPAYPGVVYIYDANAVASNGGAVRYSIRFGPSGMDVHERTGVVWWQPSQEGEYDVEIRAELANDPSVNRTQTWKVEVSKLQSHPGCTGNEAWLSVGIGLPNYVTSMTSMGEDLYALHYTGTGANSRSRLSKWDGNYWTAIGNQDVPNDSLDWSQYLVSFGSEVYRYNQQSAIAGLSSPEAIARWDGSSWSNVGASNFTKVLDAIVFDNALHVLGIRLIDQVEHGVLAKWDGTAWQTIHQERGGWGTAMASLNGTLYIASVQEQGFFGFTWRDLPIVELDNGTLTPIENRDLGMTAEYSIGDLISYDGSLIVINKYNPGRPTRWDGTKVEQMVPSPGAPLGSSGRAAAIVFDDQFYLATWLGWNPNPTIVNYATWRLNGDEWEPVPAPQVLLTSAFATTHLQFTEHKGELYSAGIITQSCGVALNNVGVLGTGGELARVSGTVFHDDSRDCVRDAGEPEMSGELVEITPGPIYAMTDATGVYTALLPPGTYTLDLTPKTYWMNTCQTSQEVTLPTAAASMENIDFGTDMIVQVSDVRASLAGGAVRPGFDVTYVVHYSNTGTELATGKVLFEYDNRFAYKTSTQAPARQNGNVLEWDFSSLPIGASVSILITLNAPASIELGTQACASAKVELLQKDDEFLDDNRDELCETVRGSYDPNDIQVSPVRFDDELTPVPLLPGDTVLSYLVRFQNTGTDTAFTVIVKDTLDPALLDVVSIRLGAASHDYDFDISGAGILTWTFNNILLPDSNVNELASHGYFKYTVHLRRGLMPLTEIPNRAAIYFDYNAPVLTNTVVSVTSGTLSVGDDGTAAASLQIYPNPVHGTSSIRLNLVEREHVSLRLIDSRGDVIAIITDKEMNAGEHTLSLNGRELSAGAYYLVLERDEKKEIYPVVIER